MTPRPDNSPTSRESAVAKALRRSLLANEQLRRTKQELVDAAREPIAVVAMGCRLPGGTDSPEELWRLVAGGADAIEPCPADRGWDLTEGSGRRGGFLRDAGGFDPGFFGISGREALAMDPQQRLLLETAWEVVERAGIVPASLRASRTGVFVGTAHQNYLPTAGQAVPEVAGYRLQGGLTSVASGRIAYTLGLNGPAVTVDTACSSSLTAIHLAVRSLRTDECSLALAGGVTVMATPEVFAEFGVQGGLAADGRCKAFGDGADGTGFAEGVGLLLLERLSDAVRAGHPVLAVVRGSAVNQDGASNGLTAPSGPAQEQVIRQALADAGLAPSDVDAVEAHGTGTTLGDPIEANALINTYGQERPADRPLLLGSLKSNIGHAQAAAGVAGVIKTVLALRHGELPRTLHADVPTSKVDWSRGAVRLLSRPCPWPESGRPRRAGVSSFGISGTNAHVILEEAPTEEAPAVEPGVGVPAPQVPAPGIVWPLSAASPGGLRARAAELARFVAESPGIDLSAVGYSLATTRAHLDHRAVLAADDRAGLLAALDALATGRRAAGLVQGVRAPSGRTAFLFSGQGSQWPGMGRALHDRSPVFAQVFDEACALLDPHLPQPLRDVVFAGPDTPEAQLLDRTDFTQAALFAVEVALYRTLEHLGLGPDFVAGHSVGEIAAAHVSGVLSLADATTLVAARGRLMRSLPATGAMVSVEAGEAEVLATLSGLERRVAVAAVNSPSATVISGDEDAVDDVARLWAGRGRRTHRLRVGRAFHSPHVDAVLDELGQVAGTLDLRAPAIPVVSTLTGGALTAAEARSPAYWSRHARGTVRFADAVARLREQGVTHFLEIGPDAVLTSLGQAVPGTGPVSEASFTPALRKGRDEVRVLTAALSGLYVRGGTLDWTRLLPHAPRVELPTYPFQHRRYWLPAPAPARAVGGGLDSVTHPFLTASVEVAGQRDRLFSGRLSVREQPWLGDHVVAGATTMAGAATAELVLHAGSLLGCSLLDELSLHRPLPLPEGVAVDIQVRVRPAGADGRRPVELHFRGPDEPDWTRHATGTLAHADSTAPDWPDLRAWPPADAEPVDLDALYKGLAEQDIGLGPAFRLITAAWRGSEGVYVEARLPSDDEGAGTGFALHPTLLDAGLQAGLIATASVNDARPRMLSSLGGVTIHDGRATAVRGLLSTTTDPSSPPGHSTHTLRLADPSGKQIAGVTSLVLRPAAAEPTGRSHGRRPRPYRVDWRTWAPSGPAAPRGVHWIVPDGDRSWLPSGIEPVFGDIGGALDAPAGRAGDDMAVLVVGGRQSTVPEDAVRHSAHSLLAVVQEWLSDERAVGRPLVVLTRGAVATEPGEDVPDLVRAPTWGLLRTAQTEHPGRFVLVDVDGHDASWRELAPAVASALAAGEPQLALRRGRSRVPRLDTTAERTELTPPPGSTAWQLTVAGRGLNLVPRPEAEAPLSAGQVRVAVRAAGISFRDVLIAAGVFPEPGPLGSEVAGVVVECGPDVNWPRVGDRVMGLTPEGGMGSLVVADQGRLVRVPEGWTFAQAATVPSAFVTAWQSLVDTAGLRPGETVLVHAAAGGVGMAAVQIARHLGADVFATAHPTKHGALRALGIDAAHLASSRDPHFEQRFRDATEGRGVDVVLHSLTGELTDASLRLLAPGGRIVDLGRADRRDPRQTESDHPGTRYMSYELPDDPERLRPTLTRLAALFDEGLLRPLPLTAVDMRHAPRAIRRVRDAAHIGKVVLTVSRPLDPGGTVLITGGTGSLGALAARHLAAEHGVRHLVLVSRRGPDAPGAAGLRARLAELGAQATLVACDTSDADALAAVVESVPADRPLTAVIHTAGAVDPAATRSLTPGMLDAVLRPKADTAWHLHRLTRQLDLTAFVLYSSSVGVLGLAGQGNYAAANTFLDALAHHRVSQGLPAISLAWGMWAERSGMGEHLGTEGIAQVLDAGLTPVPSAEGLARLDAAVGTGPDSHLPLLVPARLDPAVLRSRGLGPLVSGLTESPPPPAGPGERFTSLPDADRHRRLLDLVTQHAGAVLGHPDPSLLATDPEFRSLGFDSVTSVEMSGRLTAATGLRLPASAVFDHPTPSALAHHLAERLSGAAPRGEPARSGSLGVLLRQAVEEGRTAEAVAVLASAARLRPGFPDPPRSEHIPTVTWLRRKGLRPLLICVDSFIPATANLTYQRLAASLDGRCDLAAVALPGYRAGEALPATVDAVAEVVARAVEECAQEEPFTLVGFSTGGLAAHAAARRLESRGVQPEGVVLIDSLPPGALTRDAATDILRDWARTQGEFWAYDDTSLTAMGWYLELFGTWDPVPPTAPVLLVQAADQVPSAPADGWASHWPGLAGHVTTPGSHFGLLTEHAADTARTLTGLLDARTNSPRRTADRRH
ncbi:SDR family NAD(P)-dependent oxidoreductase [Streptomyces niveus]